MPEKSKTNATPVGELSFEAALKELEGIVSRLEQGEVDLEDSIALYERGQALKSHCEAKLKAAEGRLEKLVLGANGPTASETMDAAGKKHFYGTSLIPPPICASSARSSCASSPMNCAPT